MTHYRDQLIEFNEKEHIYTYKPTGEHFTSGTYFIHYFFPEFNPSSVIDKMMASHKWNKSPYFGMTKQEIIKKWEDDGLKSSILGTRMHLLIENYLQKTKVKNGWKGLHKEKKQFKNVKHRLNKLGYRPYRMEWRIFSEDYKLAGTLDCLWKHKYEDEYILIDWKRCKEIKLNNRYEKALSPIKKYDNCNYIQYSLQLNLYKWILETYYGINIKHMWLCSFYPTQEKEVVHIIPNMNIEIQKMLQVWKNKLN